MWTNGKFEIKPNLVIITSKLGKKRFNLNNGYLTNEVRVGSYNYYLVVKTELSKGKGINYYKPVAFIEMKVDNSTDDETVNNTYGDKKIIKQLAKMYDIVT